jgi:hypothetical protein
MKKITQRRITNPERDTQRALRLTAETLRLLDPEALARAISGCDTGSYPTDAPVVSRNC